jgi:hypothetical protein
MKFPPLFAWLFLTSLPLHSLRAENPPAPSRDAPPTIQQTPSGDPIHKLVELDSRRRIKPFELFKSAAGEYPSERLIFRDSATGNLVWKMSRNPGFNFHQYSNIPAWNLDGSQMLLLSTRPAGSRFWTVAPDGSRWTPTTINMSGWAFWNTRDAHKIYALDSGTRSIVEVDVASGQSRRIWDLSAEKGELKLFRPSVDGEKFLVREKYVPAGGNDTHSYGLILNTDGTGQPQRFDLGREAGQMWFLKRNDYAFTFGASQFDKNVPDQQWLCEPVKNGAIRAINRTGFGHLGVSPAGTRMAYRTSPPNAIWLSDAQTWEAKKCLTYDVQIARVGGNHLSWECDDRWLVASVGNSIYEVQVDAGTARPICVPNTQHNKSVESEPESSPDGTKIIYNSTMLGDCDVYVAIQRLPDAPRNIQRQGRVLTWDAPERCRELAGYRIYRGAELLNREPISERRYEVPAEDGAYAVVAVEHSGLQSALPSPAGDRIHHIPVPPPLPPTPIGLAATARSPYVVELAWTPPPFIDVSYYHVYCSTHGAPDAVQERRIASPGEAHLIDWGLQAGTEYHYVITAVDHAGNESKPSGDVVVKTQPVERVFQHVALQKPLGAAPVAVSFDVPRDDHYLLWVELKAQKVNSSEKINVLFDGAKAPLFRPAWDYVTTGWDAPSAVPFFDTMRSDGQTNPWYALKAGSHHLEFTLPTGTAEIVSLTVTNDAGYVPEGITSFHHPPR